MPRRGALDYERNVFINCPFDAEYAPLFEAIVFTVIDCGFVARCAREADDASEPRISKLLAIIGQCRLGIHDISRTEPNRAGLPRFNMPFELGLFLGAKRYGITRQRRKSCLILDRDRFRYQAFLSDIGGQDISAHDGQPERVIRIVRDWLRASGVPWSAQLPGGAAIVSRYEGFRAELPTLCATAKRADDELTFLDFVATTETWLEENPRT